MSQPFAPALSRRDWLALALVWALAVATLVSRSMHANAGGPFFLDTDDAMRMVMVRDFLHGQGWYDLIQHRLNAPYGAEIHWSRLVDLPLAVLLFLAGLVTAPGLALVVTGTVWPLLLLAVLLWLCLRITRELVGPEGLLPALVLPVLSPAVLAEFTPGRVDHHSVIILLTLGCLLGSLIAQRRPIGAWLAGLCAATALAVAIEAVPLIIAAVLAFGLAYVADPGKATNLRRFGLAFGGGMVVHLALARPPARWLEAACDMISPVFVLAGLTVAAAYLLVSLLPAPPRPWQRLLLLAILDGAAAAIVVLAYPQCLAGPYGNLDPWLQKNWIGAIVEAKPWHASLVDLPVYSVVVGVPVFLGVIGGALAFWRSPERRLEWLILMVFLLAAAVVMLAQIRGARLAILPTIPVAAWIIVSARRAYLARPRILPAALLVVAWLAFSGVILSVLVTTGLNAFPSERVQVAAQARASKLPCLAAASYADLAGLPPARIMAPIDMGSHILLETPHEVVGAPYHRNAQGVLDVFRFFGRPAGEAHDIARKRGLSLLVTCDAMPEMKGAGVNQEGTVLYDLANGTLPDWLEEVSPGGPLRVFAIAP